MPSSKRTDSPAPKASSRQVETPSSKGVRKQTRPIGEFYGNIGTGFWTFFIPAAIYYFYGIMVMHQGRLVIPGPSFWKDLWNLPDGISIRPCWGPTIVSLTWVCCQALGEIVLPGNLKEGVMLKSGRKLIYPMNGLLCFFLSHIGLFLCCYYGILKPYYVFENMGALLTEAVITSYVMALWLYVDFGIFWKRHVDDPEFEEDHGVFDYKDFFNDFFMGVVRNPRLFHGILKTPFDLKRFWNARPGLTGWVILNISYLTSMYYGCSLPSAYGAKDSVFFGDHEGKSQKIQEMFAGKEGFCNDEGSLANIGPAAVFITLAHWYYIFDYNLVEPAYLTTTDIRHDLFGFMLTYGDWGFLSRFYPISFMGFLAVQGGAKGYITQNYIFAGIGIAMYIFGMIMFRITNIEKHLFRDHLNNGGSVDKYRSPWSTRIIFGDKKVEFMEQLIHTPRTLELVTRTRGALSESRGWIRTSTQKLFGHDWNPRFAANAEVAFRGALFLLLCSIPVIIPDGVSETRDMMMKYGVYNSSVCVFIVFNLGKTFGEAFDIAISGIKGTVLAAFMGWIMYTISPGGYTDESIDFWLGVVLGSVYVCVVMLLNLNLTLQMFAISNFAGTWMVFLNPKEIAIVTPPWVGDWSLQTDILLQGLVCTAIGFATVMAAMLLPYPLWSLTYVQENQLVMNRSISKVLHMMVNYYSQTQPNVYHKDAVLRSLREVQSMTDDNDPLIRAAWWECFGMGRTQLKRQVLHTMDQMSSRVYDLAFNAWTVSTASAHEYRHLNVNLMQKVKPQTNALLDEMENLLLKLVQAISDGQLSPEEGADVASSVAHLRALEKQLSWEFYESRRTITLNDSTKMYEDVRVAQVLQWSISRIAGEIAEVAEGVCKFSTDTNALPPSPESGGMCAIFEGLHDKDHLLYAWRGISSFFLCFLIGYHGFGYKDDDQERYLISPWSSAIAATAPLLMSMYSGSALVNDLNRIQGLMLGNVLARLLGGFVDSCDWADLLFHSLTTFLWTFGGLFVYFHSRTFSTVGVLAAAFGASTLLGVSCGHPDAIGKRSTFDGLMMNCVAFMITMLMDSFFHSNRASDLAYRKLDACYNEIYQSYKSLLDPQEKKVIFRSAQARKLLFEAKQMNEEAALEPRFWRIRWHYDLFLSVCNEMENVVITLATLESAIAENGRSGDEKFPTFVQLEGSTSNNTYCMFGDEKSVILLLKFAGVRKLLKVFVHETVQQFAGFSDEDSTHQFFQEQQRVEEEFMRDTVPKFFGLDDDQPELCMSHDEMAHLSVVFAGLKRTTALLRSVQHMILASHWEA